MTARITAVQIAEAVNRDLPARQQTIPTAEQIAVIEAPLEPTLVVAGAGSGKTATMADRVVWLVVNGLAQPQEILGLTFTRKAAGELAQRVRGNLRRARTAGLFTGDAVQPTTATYNSFAAGVVRDHALRVGQDPDAALITGAGAYQLMDSVLSNWQGPLDLGGAPTQIIQNALVLAEELRSHLVDVAEARAFTQALLPGLEQVRETATSSKEAAEIESALKATRGRLALLDLVAVYFARLRAEGLLQYSDQVATACQIAREVPAVGALMREQYKTVLLDEFQDTSVAQLRFLVDLLGTGFPAMAVGDPNQAIYGWRGASASSLVAFAEQFATPNTPTRICHLTTTWRNDQAILEAANTIAESLEDDPSGAGQLLTPLGLRPGAGHGNVHRSVATTEPEEAREVARWVRERWVPGRQTAAVLCRANKQFTALLEAFRELGIEPEVVGLTGLLAAPEVIDLRAALEVAADSGRGDSMMRLLTNARLGLTDLHVLSEWSRHLAGDDARGDAEVSAAIVEAVHSPPPPDYRTRAGHQLTDVGRARIARLARQLREIRATLAYPLVDVVASAERALLLDIEVAAHPGIAPDVARGNLDAFTRHAAAHAAGTPNPTLTSFLAWLTAAEQQENGLDLAPTTVNPNAVQILTMHAAKGLEWDVVAIAGLTEGTFPHRRNSGGKLATSESGWITTDRLLPGPLRGDAPYLPLFDDGAPTASEFTTAVNDYGQALLEHSILEERRLAYVAITRARQTLLLSGSHFRAGKKPLEISRFLTELEDFSEVPEGYQVVPPPEDGAESAAASEDLALSYPGTDPWAAERTIRDPQQPDPGAVSGRRERLDAAAAAVRQARSAIASAHAGTPDAGAEWALQELSATASDRESAALVDDVRALLREAVARHSGLRVALPRNMSASSTLNFTRDPDAFALDLRRPIPKAPSRAARLGSEFHAWVEHHYGMPAFDLGTGHEEDESEGSAGQLEALKEAFLASPWALLTPEVVEIPLEVEIAGQAIACRIDAVFREDGGVVVVDWKTGARPTSEAELEHRRLQLEIYRLAYSRAFGIPLDAVTARFHYVATGETVSSGQWTEAQIVDRLPRALS